MDNMKGKTMYNFIALILRILLALCVVGFVMWALVLMLPLVLFGLGIAAITVCVYKLQNKD